MSFDLKDKVVVMTGGAIGIGALATKLFLDDGVKHVAVTDINETAGRQLEKQLNSQFPGRVSFTKCDVTDEEVLFSVFDKIVKEQGYIDIVINNAGLMNDSPAVFKKEIELNVTALVNSTLKARNIMRTDRGGRGGVIVNTSSIAALQQHYFFPIYYATKSAVLQFSNCIGAQENYEKTGVKVITICYGATDTSLLSKEKLRCLDDDVTNEIIELIKNFPVQRVESAAIGLLESCKRGASGSTWLARNDLPVEDITPVIKKAYGILTELVFTK